MLEEPLLEQADHSPTKPDRWQVKFKAYYGKDNISNLHVPTLQEKIVYPEHSEKNEHEVLWTELAYSRVLIKLSPFYPTKMQGSLL